MALVRELFAADSLDAPHSPAMRGESHCATRRPPPLLQVTRTFVLRAEYCSPFIALGQILKIKQS
jgi:hypothetical protein